MAWSNIASMSRGALLISALLCACNGRVPPSDAVNDGASGHSCFRDPAAGDRGDGGDAGSSAGALASGGYLTAAGSSGARVEDGGVSGIDSAPSATSGGTGGADSEAGGANGGTGGANGGTGGANNGGADSGVGGADSETAGANAGTGGGAGGVSGSGGQPLPCALAIAQGLTPSSASEAIGLSYRRSLDHECRYRALVSNLPGNDYPTFANAVAKHGSSLWHCDGAVAHDFFLVPEGRKVTRLDGEALVDLYVYTTQVVLLLSDEDAVPLRQELIALMEASIAEGAPSVSDCNSSGVCPHEISTCGTGNSNTDPGGAIQGAGR
jgi:hypothetical protein